MTSSLELRGLLQGVKHRKKFLSHTISWSGRCKVSFPLGFMWYLVKVLAVFFRFFGPPLRPNASNLTRQKSLFADEFLTQYLVGRNILGYWYLEKEMLTPLSCRSMILELLHVETKVAQAQHYDVIDGVIIAWSKRPARRVSVDISVAQKTGNVAI